MKRNRESTTRVRGRPCRDSLPRTRRRSAGRASACGSVAVQSRIRIKRAYEPANARDGKRVLVDRLWPRGVSRRALRLHLWLKDIAPSPALRKWFRHDPERWKEFCTRYVRELREKRAELAALEGLAREGVVTLVYAAHDRQHNHALVLTKNLAATLKRKEL